MFGMSSRATRPGCTGKFENVKRISAFELRVRRHSNTGIYVGASLFAPTCERMLLDERVSRTSTQVKAATAAPRVCGRTGLPALKECVLPATQNPQDFATAVAPVGRTSDMGVTLG